jgi:alpha-D-ribose 1-methylphosphonate 5-phosphate C-P lyase
MPRPVVVAEYESKCAACGEWILEGDEIVPDDDGDWIHAECEDE